MQLIGMLDSPYVRRVAISLQALGIPFTHRSISVFRSVDAFREINPVIKVPTLVCDDGTVLMDSTLILQYVETLSRPRTLLPQEPARLLQALRVIGLSLAACEKAVQIIYERNLRPPEKLHQPWVDRVTGQLQAAFSALEAEIKTKPTVQSAAALGQAGISAAVAWRFTQQLLPEVVLSQNHPALAALSGVAEMLPEFVAAPYGDGIVGSG